MSSVDVATSRDDWVNDQLVSRYLGKGLTDEQFLNVRASLAEEFAEFNQRRLLREAKKLDAEYAAKSVVYFAQESEQKLIKIGTSRCLKKRLHSIATSIPSDLGLLAVTQGAYRVEAWMHDRFKRSRVKGEWFLPTHDLISEIERLT